MASKPGLGLLALGEFHGVDMPPASTNDTYDWRLAGSEATTTIRSRRSQVCKCSHEWADASYKMKSDSRSTIFGSLHRCSTTPPE